MFNLVMGKKIFIAEDDPEISSLIQYTLETLGYQVQTCATGREVLDALRAFKPDVMLLDVMLPGVDGYSLAMQISEDVDLNQIPIVVITALDPSKIMFQRFPQVAGFITKPFNTDDLTKTIESILEKKK